MLLATASLAFRLPTTSKLLSGFVVPIPTFPVEPSTVSRVISFVNKFTSCAAPVPTFKLEGAKVVPVRIIAASALLTPPIVPVAALPYAIISTCAPFEAAVKPARVLVPVPALLFCTAIVVGALFAARFTTSSSVGFESPIPTSPVAPGLYHTSSPVLLQ